MIKLLAAILALLVFDGQNFVKKSLTENFIAEENAEGIIVLTGGKYRVSEGLKLLAQKRGKRLLITGVNPSVTQVQLRKNFNSYKSYFDCCVDLDYQALNTQGNAVEASFWATTNGYTSLIVVTTGFHLPRTMIEFQRIMPNIKLIPHTAKRDDDRFRANIAKGRMWGTMLSEYFKYRFAWFSSFIASIFE